MRKNGNSEKFLKAIEDGYETMPEIRDVLGWTLNQAHGARNYLIERGLIEAYDETPGRPNPQGRRAKKYRVSDGSDSFKVGVAVTSLGAEIVQSALDRLRVNPGPFGGLLA